MCDSPPNKAEAHNFLTESSFFAPFSRGGGGLWGKSKIQMSERCERRSIRHSPACFFLEKPHSSSER